MEPTSKHQVPPKSREWVGWRGKAWKFFLETKFSGASGDRKHYFFCSGRVSNLVRLLPSLPKVMTNCNALDRSSKEV